jgi:carboxypeptidase family protein/TonB-dependent receptor-like protein
MCKTLFVISVVLGLSLSPTAAPAQETRGSILGRVLDPSGAAIPGATVQATNMATNVTNETASNATGNYTFSYLLPGTYRITADMPGFKTLTRQGIDVRINDQVSIDIPMQLGDVGDKVTVTAETPMLEATNASMGQVVDQRRVAELPTAHGNPYQLIGLSPGVAHTQSLLLDQPYAPTHIVGYSMDGVRANRSEVTLDGVSNTALLNRFGAGDLMAGYSPPADVVQELKIQTLNVDASLGHTQGGVTSVTLKSGGNQAHGTLYYALFHPALNANLFFANRAGQPKGQFKYHRYGASLTGPVMIPGLYNGKDRTFFTYGYEGIRVREPRGATLTVPTERERQGDFSELLRLGPQYQIYDPATRAPAPNGRFTVQPFPGNIIPPERISPIARRILEFYALPNAAGTADGTNNLVRETDPERLKYANQVVRVDHNFSSKHRVFGRYNTYSRNSFLNDWFRSAATGGTSDWKQHAFSFDDVYQLSPSTILNVRYGFYQLRVLQIPKPDSLGFDLASLGFPGNYVNAIPQSVRAFPFINIANYSATQNNWWLYPSENQSLEGHLTKVLRNHTVKVGGDFRIYQNSQSQWHSSSTGNFAFGTSWTQGPFDNSPASPKGQGLASLLLGLPTGGGVDRFASFVERSTVYSLYAQDDVRVTPNFTLNLGVRWELEGPMTERLNRSVRGFDFSTPSPLEAQVRANYARNPIAEIPADQFRVIGGPTFAGVGGLPRALWSMDKNNVMPRIGFAYALGEQTVLRGGFGVFYGALGAQRGDVLQSGFSQTTNLIPSLDNGLTFDATLSNPFPSGILEPRGSADGLLTFVGRGLSFFDENPKAPYQRRWQVSIQRVLPKRVLLDVAYVGNRGGDLETAQDHRPLPLQYLSRSPVRDQANIDYLTQQVPNPFFPLLPGTGLSGQTVSRSYLLSSGLQPHFTGLTSTTYDGYSTYHALQVRTERRFAAGWSVNAAYTLSKSMEALGRLNGFLSPLEYVVSASDRPHRFAASGIWELPFGRGRRFLASPSGMVNHLLGGWQVQGIYTFQSGEALGFGNALFTGNVEDIALPSSQRTPERWFNTDGFERSPARQLAFNFRTLPTRLREVRGDGISVWDLSAIKRTRVRGFDVQYRAEFLNAFNHPMFFNPNTSPTSTAFGTVTGQKAHGRRIQMQLKILF